MADQIQKLDLTDAAEQLRERIQLAFVELIPKEQWETMIQAELKRFTEPQRVRDYPHGPERIRPSVFSELCSDVLKKQARAELEKLLAENTTWGDQVSELVKAWMTENAQAILETAILGMCQSAAQSLLNNLKGQF